MKFIHYKADAAATLFVAISLAILPGAALAKGNHHPNHPDGSDLMQTTGSMSSDASITNNLVTTIIRMTIVIMEFMVAGMAYVTARAGLGITGEHLPEVH